MRPYRRISSALIIGAVLTPIAAGAALLAQSRGAQAPAGSSDDPPPLSSLVAFARTESDLRGAVNRYVLDKAALERRYEIPFSPERNARLKAFYDGWRKRVAEADFNGLNPEGKIDFVMLRNRIDYDIEMQALADRRWTQMAPLLPFFDKLRQLPEDRNDRKRADPRATATTLNDLAREIGQLTAKVAADRQPRTDLDRVVATRAAAQIDALRPIVADWRTFYDGYDPVMSWWIGEPYGRFEKALVAYADALRTHIVGVRPGVPAPIVGDPVLAEGLKADLAFEMIPYTPDELLAIGQREFDATEAQFKVVAREMGFGDDWKAALEHTKNLAPPPGEAPWAIFDIARYSEDFIEKMHSVTMAPLAREVWRLAMQTPERQLINPFFTGGELTRVSYPTDTMTHDDKLMSLRGNTPPFNFATVHHELVPGHHLQQFLSERFNPQRLALQRTPFWREGWALYWELQLWDRGFARTGPEKIGMLFWRLHRAARIVFSLNYHLGRWTPQQAVDFLVERVGHERANAEGEVRRTTIDAPLYQAAYLLGGLQFRALYRDFVESGKMTATAFHDAILIGGFMPVELVRARLDGAPIPRDFKTTWRFYR
jgi:uncharacterized protein (DUF885 family)